MIEAAEKLRPEVIAGDVAMPNLNVLEAFDARPSVDLPRHQGRFPYDASERGIRAGACSTLGACGFVVKHSAPEELVACHPCGFEREDLHHTFL